jgi:hypothetical protein
LFDAIRGCLDRFAVRPGSYAVKRFGDARDLKALEERIGLA